MSREVQSQTQDMLLLKERPGWVKHETTSNGDVVYCSSTNATIEHSSKRWRIEEGEASNFGSELSDLHNKSRRFNECDRNHERSLSGHFLNATSLSGDVDYALNFESQESKPSFANRGVLAAPGSSQDDFSCSRNSRNAEHLSSDQHSNVLPNPAPSHGDSLVTTKRKEDSSSEAVPLQRSVVGEHSRSLLDPVYAGSGHKHHRAFSNGRLNPALAHRRINSGDNTAFVSRNDAVSYSVCSPYSSGTSRQYPLSYAPPLAQIHLSSGHHRENSAGLDMLSAAANVSNEELATAAGVPVSCAVQSLHRLRSSSLQLQASFVNQPSLSGYGCSTGLQPSQHYQTRHPLEARPSSHHYLADAKCRSQPPRPATRQGGFSDVPTAQETSSRRPLHPSYQQHHFDFSQPLGDRLRSYNSPPLPLGSSYFPVHRRMGSLQSSHYPIQYSQPPLALFYERKSTGLPAHPLAKQFPVPYHQRHSSVTSVESDIKIDTDEPLFSSKPSMPPPPPPPPPPMRASPRISPTLRSSPTDFANSLHPNVPPSALYHSYPGGEGTHSGTGATTGVQTFVTTISIGDGIKTIQPNKPTQRNADTSTDPPTLDASQPSSGSIPPEIGGSRHHRKLSSFSSFGTLMGPGLFPEIEGGHHRLQSTVTNFIQSLGDGTGENFLQNITSSPTCIKDENKTDIAPKGQQIECDYGTTNSSLINTSTSAPLFYDGMNIGSTNQSTNRCVPSPIAESQSDNSASGDSSRHMGGGTSKRIRRKCTVAGCANRVVQGGLCISHGAKRKTCNHPGCNKNVKKAGLCSTHGPARKRCENVGCGKVAVQGGKCIAHGARKKLCCLEGCAKQAILSGMCKKHHDQENGVVAARGGKRQSEFSANSEHLSRSSTLSMSVVIDGRTDMPSPDGDCSTTSSVNRTKSSKPPHKRGLSIFQEMSAVDTILGNDGLGDEPQDEGREGSYLSSEVSRDESPALVGNGDARPDTCLSPPVSDKRHHQRGLSIFTDVSVAASIIEKGTPHLTF